MKCSMREEICLSLSSREVIWLATNASLELEDDIERAEEVAFEDDVDEVDEERFFVIFDVDDAAARSRFS